MNPGSGRTRKTYLARVSGDFGERLPVDRRQPGSPSSPAAAAAAASSGRANGGSPSTLPMEGGVGLPEVGGKPADPGTQAAGDTNDDSETSPAEKNDGGVVVKDAAAGDLWWRYEYLGEGVVVKEGKGRAVGRIGASGPAAAGASATGDTAEGGACVEKTAEATVGEASAAAAERLSSGSGGSGGGGGCGGMKEEVMVRVNCPIRVLDHKNGVYECNPLGKEAQTVGDALTLMLTFMGGVICFFRVW